MLEPLEVVPSGGVAHSARQDAQSLLVEAAPDECQLLQLATDTETIAGLAVAAAAPEEWEAMQWALPIPSLKPQ